MNNLRVRLVTITILGIGLIWVSDAAVHAQDIPTPHEVHAYDQARFVPNDAWKCKVKDGCVICENVTTEPAIVEVKAMYKRADLNVRDMSPLPGNLETREHCVNPGQEVWACLNGYIIEPEPGSRPNTPGNPSTCP
jgi:hypothetical protein